MLVVFKAMSRRNGAVVNDDVLFGFRLRLFSLAAELGNVRAACRMFGIHPSTYYRWRRQEHPLEKQAIAQRGGPAVAWNAQPLTADHDRVAAMLQDELTADEAVAGDEQRVVGQGARYGRDGVGASQSRIPLRTTSAYGRREARVRAGDSADRTCSSPGHSAATERLNQRVVEIYTSEPTHAPSRANADSARRATLWRREERSLVCIGVEKGRPFTGDRPARCCETMSCILVETWEGAARNLLRAGGHFHADRAVARSNDEWLLRERLGDHRLRRTRAAARLVLHLHAAVDLPAFRDRDRSRDDVALHGGRRLDLDALRRGDRALDGAADDRLTGVDVAADDALPPDEHLARGAHVALDAALDLHDAVAVDVAVADVAATPSAVTTVAATITRTIATMTRVRIGMS